MPSGNQNGWNEYSRLVLKELETLADSIDNLRTELQEMKQELAKMQVRENKIEDLKVSVTDVSENKTIIRIHGREAYVLLSKFMVLDLETNLSTNLSCAQTLFVKVPVLLVRNNISPFCDNISWNVSFGQESSSPGIQSSSCCPFAILFH